VDLIRTKISSGNVAEKTEESSDGDRDLEDGIHIQDLKCVHVGYVNGDDLSDLVERWLHMEVVRFTLRYHG
jgi:hypothetical protein